MTNPREQILAAVRRATNMAGGAGDVVAARIAARAPNLRPARGADDALVVSRFAEEAERAGTDVRHAASVDDIPAIIADYLRDQNLSGDIRVSGDPVSKTIPWTAEPLLSVSTGAAEPGDTASFSVAACGIAETGTLMMASSPDNPTMLNYLPFLHIGVLRQDRIVGSLETAWDLMRNLSGSKTTLMPRMVNLITGPSRTADIEQELLMGAHGPQKHMLIILRQD